MMMRRDSIVDLAQGRDTIGIDATIGSPRHGDLVGCKAVSRENGQIS